MRIYTRVFLLLLMTVVVLLAGVTGKISGTVTDKNTGEPLVGANVLIEGQLLGASTDADGYFVILNIPPGTYTVKCDYIGYQGKVVSGVKVTPDFTTRLDFELQEAALELGDVIEVVAEREVIKKDLTASQSNVSSDDIENLPTETFQDVLQIQAGITRDDVGGFHIRGGRSSEVAFWVDGVSVTDAFDGSVGIEVDNNAIQNLQVISGTFNAEYGQAMSGIVNIVTKEGGQKFEGNMTLYTGDYISGDKDIFWNIDNVSPRHIQNYQFSLSGPIPILKNLNFYTNFRNYFNEGWLYGQYIYKPDGTPGDSSYYAMNPSLNNYFQAKITYKPLSALKLNYSVNYNYSRWRSYDHFNRLNPTSLLRQFKKSLNQTFTIDHTLNTKTFYTVKGSYFYNNYWHYVYKDPFDSRYVNDAQFSVPSYNFGIGGNNKNRFERTTEDFIFKFDLTSQATKRHLVKTGVEIRKHNLDYFSINVIDGDPGNSENFIPTLPDPNNPNYNSFSYDPIEVSAYIQDKVEYDDFIMNIGVRFDYFDSRGQVLADPKDPSPYNPLREDRQDLTPEEAIPIWFKKPEAKYQLSPRLGIAYPISAEGVIHFSYGHFLQIPEFQYLYANPSFRIGSGTGNLLGNADLDAQRTIMYEIGLQQQVSPDMSLDITGFYRDIRGWIGTSTLMPTYAPDIFYSIYENRDYANVRGVTIKLDRRFANNFSFNVDYTFQIAEGSASNPEDRFNALLANAEPKKQIIPLSWDRTHVINAYAYVNIKGFGLSVINRLESGAPYTPEPFRGSRTGFNLEKGVTENSGRKPTLWNLDLQLYKDLSQKIGDKILNYSFFVKVYNLLDRRNENGVYGDTGRATYNLGIKTAGSDANPEYINNPSFYSEPRRVQVGMSVNF
ncbi:MAG: hypothetical protein Kow00108_11620 [Calditrichia bacterium]